MAMAERVSAGGPTFEMERTKSRTGSGVCGRWVESEVGEREG